MLKWKAVPMMLFLSFELALYPFPGESFAGEQSGTDVQTLGEFFPITGTNTLRDHWQAN